jgi:hypothetical protein
MCSAVKKEEMVRTRGVLYVWQARNLISYSLSLSNSCFPLVLPEKLPGLGNLSN